ncbi:phosphorylase b kinase gamma catalytic chain, skeletal muscle/heart isoform isoform X2 [Ctenocephalides felis]|uniref:phosphorylase b kinase gamma catalytic chain, skeletal muscle/heart isoform isoform X2 n=1 Tax=Ctenocephalides felis TaxID=7515 RepID=UPI000E6E4883|nr:phosphorylase b kinase gamma catalytic chain, skeletal muscle/heart isoform isoform X2 [Ctenocephalides felis]
MAKDEDDKLPDKDAAREFYAKYEPKEILGRGISSTVRRCIEKESGKEFAAKIIDLGTEGCGDEVSAPEYKTMKESTHQEVNILRHVLGHPYIIELQDVFESDTFIFLVFELCRNGELFDYLTSVVTLTEKKTKYIMRQIFEGVLFIHKHNIVHRDLKPENILLDDNMNIKITDFGFAKKIKQNEKLYELCGTPGYLAPETLRCSMYENALGYSKEVDIWACGIIMFTLLVGCPPFWHRKQIVMFRNIMEGKYNFASPEWADISDAPKDLLRKLLVVDPSKRISIENALKHPFFQSTVFEQNVSTLKRSLSSVTKQSIHSSPNARTVNQFCPRKMFQKIILCVRAVIRLNKMKLVSEHIPIRDALLDPYRLRILRKVIDGCAFRVYGHWVKKGEEQNRAALFENSEKTELYYLYLMNLGGR